MQNIRTTKKGCKQTDGRWQQKSEADSTCIINVFIIFCELLCIYFRAAAQNSRFKRRMIKSERDGLKIENSQQEAYYEENMRQRVRKTPAALPPSLLIGQHIPRLAAFRVWTQRRFLLTTDDYCPRIPLHSDGDLVSRAQNQTEYADSRFLNQQLHQ